MFRADKRWLLPACFEFYLSSFRLTKFENICLYALSDSACCPCLGTKNEPTTLLAGLRCERDGLSPAASVRLCVWPPLGAVLEVSVWRRPEAVATANWAGLWASLRLHCQWGTRMTSLSGPGRLTPARTLVARPSPRLGGPGNNPVESGCASAPSPPPPQGLLSPALYSHMPRSRVPRRTDAAPPSLFLGGGFGE